MKSIDAACFRAWGRMYRQRHCPDLKVLMEGSRQAQRHLASCSMCRARLDSAAEAAELGALLAKIPLHIPPATPPRPGEIRALRPMEPGLPGLPWLDRDKRFCNAPLLLVLSLPDAQGFVQVAQVFDEPVLCRADEDIPLRTGLFAEAWNTYAVPAQALDPVIHARAEERAAEHVRRRAREPVAAVEEDAPVHAFRLDECRIGSLFSLQLTLHVLKELEQGKEPADRLPAHQVPRTRLAQPGRQAEQRSRGLEVEPEPEPVLWWQERMLCAWTGADLPMNYVASGSPGSLGRGPGSRVTAHRVLICPPGGMPRWIPADVRLRECAGKTLFSITCQPEIAPWPVSVFAFYRGQCALAIQAGWLRDRILQIDVSFAGSIRDLAWLHIAVEANSVEGSRAEDLRPGKAGGDRSGQDAKGGGGSGRFED